MVTTNISAESTASILQTD